MIAVWEKEWAVAGLEGLPGWALKANDSVRWFTQAGFTGLMDYHAVTNQLGELLARGEVTPARIQEFLDNLRKPVPATAAGSATAPSPTEIILRTGPQNFWAVAWNEILGNEVMKERKILVPPFPMLKAKTRAVITGGLGMWIPVFLPAELTEADYPADFIKPQWERHLTESNIQRRPLPGRWVMVETIPKPNWDDQNGYGNGNDPLAKALGLNSRFSVSWDDLHEIHLPKVAKAIGLSKKAVRLPTAEEWNLIGNLFLWLNTHRNMNLPDLGSTNSWEWAENSYGDGDRLIVGYRGLGGLAGVYFSWHSYRGVSVGFRVLAVL